jgi:predicted amino acid dehydrogenase
MKSSFRILEVSFGRPSWDDSFHFELAGHKFDVQRVGANFSIEAMKQIIRNMQFDVDAIAVNHLPPRMKLKNKAYLHPQYLEVMNLPSPVPLRDGTGLREICNLLSLRSLIEKGDIDPSKGIFFPTALFSLEVEEFLRKEYGAKIFLGDAFSLLGLPLVISPFKGLARLAGLAIAGASFKDLRSATPVVNSRLQTMGRSLISSQIEGAHYVMADLGLLLLFGNSLDFIRHKELIVTSHHKGQEEALRKFSPRRIMSLLPERFRVGHVMNYPILDAALCLANGKTGILNLKDWEDLLEVSAQDRQAIRRYVLIRNESVQSKVSQTIYKVRDHLKKAKKPDFAFVIHALSHHDFENAPFIGKAIGLLPEQWNDGFDQVVAKLPPFVYGEINHITSRANGKEVNGIIYAVPATPKILKGRDPKQFYRMIERVCYDAASRGAKIIGLGAYTKIVGDSGVSISQLSPIPVTTGNSLSASATLWGLRDVMLRMKLVTTTGPNSVIQGSAMVIGATGSIGRVSAKLLSLAFKKIFLVAPRMDRLMDLAREITKMSPGCELILSQDANSCAEEVDALVTATSAFDHKIVDVMSLKPGCVVCDCSRPLDFTMEDAQKRPDVLIMESGEVLLPGAVDIKCELGLPGKAVYACLAETALLALEGRYESYTLGRDLDWKKVKDIYKLALKHGVELAEIQGHMGFVTQREIELIRELVLRKQKPL